MEKRRAYFLMVCFLCSFLFFTSGQVSAQADSSLLKEGATGNEVYILQNKLKQYGYYQGPLDSSFGEGTREAVVEFQLDCGLDADGVVGPSTLQALRDYKASDVSRGSSNRWRGQQIVSLAKQYWGVPYVWAGRSPSGFDCSGFTSYVYSRMGISIPRMADDQFYAGMRVNDLQPGDLVFFTTYEPGPSHVGIYVGNGQFIHASSGVGQVTVTSLSNEYYSSRYLGARRFI
jgi:cell wall-associated NlpC family hydrolase